MTENYKDLIEYHSNRIESVPQFPDTTGKVVTLPKGVVVTDIGPKTDCVRIVQADNGDTHYVSHRVVAELPITHRRASL